MCEPVSGGGRSPGRHRYARDSKANTTMKIITIFALAASSLAFTACSKSPADQKANAAPGVRPSSTSAPSSATSSLSTQSVVVTDGLGKDVLKDRGLNFSEVGFWPPHGLYFAITAGGNDPVAFSEAVVELRAHYVGFSPTDTAEKSPASPVELIMAAQVGFVGNFKDVRYFYSDRMGKHYSYPRRDGHIDLPAMTDARLVVIQPGETIHIPIPDNLFSENLPPPPAGEDLIAITIVKRPGQADSVFRMTHVFEKARDTVLRTEPVDSSQ